MPTIHPTLPQLDGSVFLTDGGLETALVYIEGIDLPCFAAFPLLSSRAGRETLERYFTPYLRTASERGVGFVLDTPTWRANADWGAKLGFDSTAVSEVNRQAVAFARDLRNRFLGDNVAILINGVIGPRGDGYQPTVLMSADEAERYHAAQVETFRDSDVDMVSAITINYVEEAIGIANTAKKAGIPSVISFTLETDGRLASGETLRSAIERTDRETEKAPAYYMINCAHPDHFKHMLDERAPWSNRIRGLRANASSKSHAELDQSTELDNGNPAELAQHYRALQNRLHGLSVLGGCCGTDHRHIVAICDACLPAASSLQSVHQIE